MKKIANISYLVIKIWHLGYLVILPPEIYLNIAKCNYNDRHIFVINLFIIYFY